MRSVKNLENLIIHDQLAGNSQVPGDTKAKHASHTVFRIKKQPKVGSKKGDDFWFLKELGELKYDAPDKLSAKSQKLYNAGLREVVAQEFSRLLMPYQPKTRLVFDKATNKIYIMSKGAPGFTSLEDLSLQSRKDVLTSSDPSKRAIGFGKYMIARLYTNEVDLKPANGGPDSRGYFIGIDGDWCFARLQADRYRKYEKAEITPEMIANLPGIDRSKYYAWNWLDVCYSLSDGSASIDNPQYLLNPNDPNLLFHPNFNEDTLFRSEVNEAMLQIILMPDRVIEDFVRSYVTDEAEIALLKGELIDRKRALKEAAIQNPSFQFYCHDEDVIQAAIEGMIKITEEFKTTSKNKLIYEFDGDFREEVEEGIYDLKRDMSQHWSRTCEDALEVLIHSNSIFSDIYLSSQGPNVVDQMVANRDALVNKYLQIPAFRNYFINEAPAVLDRIIQKIESEIPDLGGNIPDNLATRLREEFQNLQNQLQEQLNAEALAREQNARAEEESRRQKLETDKLNADYHLAIMLFSDDFTKQMTSMSYPEPDITWIFSKRDSLMDSLGENEFFLEYLKKIDAEYINNTIARIVLDFATASNLILPPGFDVHIKNEVEKLKAQFFKNNAIADKENVAPVAPPLSNTVDMLKAMRPQEPPVPALKVTVTPPPLPQWPPVKAPPSMKAPPIPPFFGHKLDVNVQEAKAALERKINNLVSNLQKVYTNGDPESASSKILNFINQTAKAQLSLLQPSLSTRKPEESIKSLQDIESGLNTYIQKMLNSPVNNDLKANKVINQALKLSTSAEVGKPSDGPRPLKGGP